MRDLDSRLELRVTGDVVEGLGHQVRRAAVDDAAFEEDAEEREARVARGQDVVGVQVAQAEEDPLQLHVELGLGEVGQPVPQEAERLQRVDGVHGALEGQVGVDLPDQDLGLIQDDTALGIGERALRDVARNCGMVRTVPRSLSAVRTTVSGWDMAGSSGRAVPACKEPLGARLIHPAITPRPQRRRERPPNAGSDRHRQSD